MTLELSGTDDAGLEQIELAAAVHLAFHEFELDDLPFGLAIGPGRCDRGVDGRLVFDDTVGELGDQARSCPIQPGLEISQ